jgi:hypothetical protein
MNFRFLAKALIVALVLQFAIIVTYSYALYLIIQQLEKKPSFLLTGAWVTSLLLALFLTGGAVTTLVHLLISSRKPR